MQYNKEEVERHLDIITGYINFIESLNKKYIKEKSHIKKKLVQTDLIYYSDGLLKRLTEVFDYIHENFKNTGNLFILDYKCEKITGKVTLDKICRSSLKQLRNINQMKKILETALRVVNNEATQGDKMYLACM